MRRVLSSALASASGSSDDTGGGVR
jgi:hypothetical protein